MPKADEEIIHGWIDSIPSDELGEMANLLVEQVGFRAGPSFIGGLNEDYKEPVSLRVALSWLTRYSRSLRRAHVRFTDGSVMWMEQGGFTRWDREGKRPTAAGVVVQHDPDR